MSAYINLAGYDKYNVDSPSIAREMAAVGALMSMASYAPGERLTYGWSPGRHNWRDHP